LDGCGRMPDIVLDLSPWLDPKYVWLLHSLRVPFLVGKLSHRSLPKAKTESV